MADAVTSLGYLGIGSAQLEAWRKFAEHVVGAQVTPGVNGLSLRIDERAWRIAMFDGPSEDIEYVGFEVPDAQALARVERRLTHAGFEVQWAGERAAAARSVLELLRARDPDGLAVEIFYGASGCPDAAFVSSVGGAGFVTGAGGLGHVAIGVSSLAGSRAFYEHGLGLKLSDVVDMPGHGDRSVRVVFLHCNARHHSVALAEMPGPKRLHHFMLQMASLSDVGRALDRAAATGWDVCRALGQHTNDRMVSFYVRSPSGFEVELGWGGIEVDSEWSTSHYTSGSLWGHAAISGH